ncbi:eIF3 subunit 6 N terminal domain-containing protein [Cladochytrium replicatum]|nr:eIF3 subunit 6 N terminal domain-containing protein [Cladochytrium replicatum]
MPAQQQPETPQLQPNAMLKYDLTTKIAAYLDRHMIFPLLEFLESQEIYNQSTILNAKYDLLKSTNMVDFANQVWQAINNTDSKNAPGYEQKRTEVLAHLEQLEEETSEIMAMIQDPAVIQQLKQDKAANIQFLRETHGYKPEMLSSWYNYSMFMYQVGRYGQAAEMLYHYRILTTDIEKNISAMWGKLAAEILGNNWETALEDLMRLKELIETRNPATTSHSQQLLQRTWLIHWSLFVFFNHPKGRDAIVDLLFQPAYLNTVQTSCPWILRYLAAAVITNRKRRSTALKDLVNVIKQESHAYRDPVTMFVECLYVDFDFDGAQRMQKECEAVLGTDFFLVSTMEEFVENARLMIFETYCRIHQCIDISGLSEKLNMDREEGEKWIVNLIRNAKMDAKIDAKTNTVIMGTQYPSVHQSVIERTRALTFRTSLLSSNIDKRETELANRRNQLAQVQSGTRSTGGNSGRRDRRVLPSEEVVA